MPSKMGAPTKLDARLKRAFCEAYAKTGLMYRSAEVICVSQEAVRVARKKDKEFDAAIQEAYDKFKEALEQEAINRAVNGWEEPVYQGGELVGHVRKKSDRIFELLLKRHIPAYRDRQQVDMNVTSGVLVVPSLPKTTEEWEAQHSD